MSMAHVEYETGSVLVEFPYEPELIQRLKDEIPAYARGWVQHRKAWRISAEYWDQAKLIIETYVEIQD